MITSTGPLSEPYETISVVYCVISKKANGCSGQHDVMGAYDQAIKLLSKSAKDLYKADAVICLTFQYRVSIGKSCGGGSEGFFELYAQGTAVRLKR
jgi:uncharacterized protein YbjQ (UPF0145 family)